MIIATALLPALLVSAARAVIRPPPAPAPITATAASFGGALRGALFLVSHPCQS